MKMNFVFRKPEDILESGLDFFSGIEFFEWEDINHFRKLKLAAELELYERPYVSQDDLEVGRIDALNPNCVFASLIYCCSHQRYNKVKYKHEKKVPKPMAYEYFIEIKSEKEFVDDSNVKFLGKEEFEFVLNSFSKYSRLHTFK